MLGNKRHVLHGRAIPTPVLAIPFEIRHSYTRFIIAIIAIVYEPFYHAGPRLSRDPLSIHAGSLLHFRVALPKVLNYKALYFRGIRPMPI